MKQAKQTSKWLQISLMMKEFFILLILTMLSKPIPAGSLTPYTNSELDQLEKEFVQLINQSDSVERTPLAKEYINRIGLKLAQFAGITPPSFFIVKSREINAFAGPGGYIGINSQLILTTNDESELAAVMAHEIAHVRLHHLYAALEHQKQMRIPMLASLLASAALGLLNPTVGLGAMMASTSGFAQDSINFTRSKEKEADRIGIDMLTKAGFNPRRMAEFFKKMQQNSRYYYADIPSILRSHPLDDDRIAEAENRTFRLPPSHYIDSTEYAFFKELIRVSVSGDDKQLLGYYQHQCRKNLAACQYGHVLLLLQRNRHLEAATLLSPLLSQDPDNHYLQIAMAQAEVGQKNYSAATRRMAELYALSSENYALLMSYAEILLAANQTAKASDVLLKGSRQYSQDLTLCQLLARSQASLGKKNYAYFTQAQCLFLEGQKPQALAQLKLAQDLSKQDAYLTARILAKIEEIKS